MNKKSLQFADDANMKNSETLDLSNQGLKEFVSPYNLSRLRYLYLENNRLEQLPRFIFSEAPNLIWLDARNNRIDKIPDSIENHACLETILLQNNRISYLPPEIATCKSLKTLQLAGNPITYPSKNVINSGLESLFAYLRLDFQKNKGDFSETISHDESNEINECASYDDENDDEDFGGDFLMKRNKYKRISESCIRASLKRSYDVKLPVKNSNRYLKQKAKAPTKDEQDLRIRESLLRDIWLEKRKDLLTRREKALQDQKSLDALKGWRKDYKLAQSNNNNLYYTLNLSHLPYDTDLNCVKILTRADIEKDLPDKYKKKIKRSAQKPSDKIGKRDSLQPKIDQLIEDLQSMRGQNFELTPRTERRMITCEIKKLSELQKKISQLKAENR